jgi:hypothetical protein
MNDLRLWFDDKSHWFFLGVTVAAMFLGYLAITLSLGGH